MATKAQNAGVARGGALRIVIWAGAALLLLAPLVGMQVTDEVHWSLADFALFGAMLLAVCGGYELAARTMGDGAYRAAAGLALVGAFLLVWINLAVGVIGTEDNPANLLFAGVLAVGLGGAVVARGRAHGMARALLATAIAQALVGVVALVLGSLQAVGVTGLFIALWLASAWLFRKAAQRAPARGA